MARAITVKLDVTKLDKTRFFKGQKGIYVDLIMFETPGGQYGDWMVKQSMTKEESKLPREKQPQLPIAGNGKNMGWDEPRGGGGRRDESEYTDDGEEIPF